LLPPTLTITFSSPFSIRRVDSSKARTDFVIDRAIYRDMNITKTDKRTRRIKVTVAGLKGRIIGNWYGGNSSIYFRYIKTPEKTKTGRITMPVIIM
jgi:hypothetical protein